MFAIWMPVVQVVVAEPGIEVYLKSNRPESSNFERVHRIDYGKFSAPIGWAAKRIPRKLVISDAVLRVA